MILDTTTRSLQVVLTTAVTSVNMAVVVDYVDNTTTTFTPGLSPSTTNGVTPVVILSAPGSGVQRKVNSISINNIDTASKVVQVFLNDNSTLYQITQQTLAVGDTLCYSDTNGWYTKDSNGNIKGVGTPGTNGTTGPQGPISANGYDANDGEEGLPGVPGARGTNGTTGPAGPIGIFMQPDDPDDAMPIPGPRGPAGTNGTNGTGGFPGTDGMDGEDAWMIPGPPGISAASVAQGPAFSAYLPTTNQSISSGVLTKVSLSSKEFDTTGAFDSTTNFRFQPLISGYYNITAVASMSGAAGTASSIIIYKNGSAFKNGTGETGAITAVQLDVSALIFLNGSTDYIELFVSYTGTTPVVVFGSNNTFFQGNLVSGIASINGGGIQGPTFSAYQSTLQSLSAATFTKCVLQTKEFDTTNSFDNVTNNRFQPTVSGYYQVSGSFQAVGSSQLAISIYKNGSSFKNGNNISVNANQVGTSALIFLNGSTDYVEMWVFSAAAQNTSPGNNLTFFQAAYIPPTGPQGFGSSMVRLNTANGYGSTNTATRRFSTVVTNQGSDITYTDSATLGALFTINTNGVYAISYTDQFNAGQLLAITLNASSGATIVSSLTANEILVSALTSSANNPSTAAITLYLPSGSLIRPQTDAVPSGTGTTKFQFTITRIA